jgi:hypothetical protein
MCMIDNNNDSIVLFIYFNLEFTYKLGFVLNFKYYVN